MKNLTITVDEDVARWVRVEAAKRKTSVSRLVGEILRERMHFEDAYEEARRQFLAIEPRTLRAGDTPLPSRQEVHDRTGIR